MELVDRFEGEQLGENKVSQAFRLRYRGKNETLTDDKIQPVHDKVRAAFTSNFKLNSELIRFNRANDSKWVVWERSRWLECLQPVGASRWHQRLEISGWVAGSQREGQVDGWLFKNAFNDTSIQSPSRRIKNEGLTCPEM